MFIYRDVYLKELKKLINKSDDLICAVAFWGKGAEKLLTDRKGKKNKTTRIICNLRSGATNPDVIHELMEFADVRQLDDLHAKVIAGNDKAIVGSANFSCNGLNLEGEEQVGWSEAGIVTEIKAELDSIRKWFNDHWENSENISDRNIEDARIIWKNRRNNRIWIHKPKQPLLEASLSELKDRLIYLAIYREHFGDIENKALEKVRKREGAGNQLDAYGDWGGLLQKLEKEALLINIYYGSRGGLTYEGTHSLVRGWIEPIEGMEGGLEMCWKATIPHVRFNQEDQRNLCQILKPAMERIWESRLEDYEAVVMPLAEALEIAYNR